MLDSSRSGSTDPAQGATIAIKVASGYTLVGGGMPRRDRS